MEREQLNQEAIEKEKQELMKYTEVNYKKTRRDFLYNTGYSDNYSALANLL